MGSNRARNFRRRGDNGDDDKDADVSSASAPSKPPSTSSSHSSAKPKKLPTTEAPKKKLLSFADDDDDGENGGGDGRTLVPPPRPKPKKPSASSHKLTSSKEHRSNALFSSSSSPAPPQSNVQPQAGIYTKEALLELQKNTRTLPFSRGLAAAEPKIVLKGLIKPPQQKDSETDVVKRVSELESDEEEGREGEDQNGSGGVLDQAAIDAIRAKREKMRQARTVPAPDYIALDGSTSSHGAAEGLSDEDADFQGSFLGERLGSSKKGVFDAVVNERVITKDTLYHDDDEEDEEEKLWEEEQFKKGLGKRMDDGSSKMVGVKNGGVVGVRGIHNVEQQQQQQHVYGAMPGGSVVTPSIGAGGFANGLDTMSISQQAELAKQALQENLRKLKESHGKTQLSLINADENLSASLMNITVLEKSLAAAGEKYIFMQKLRDFVSVICDFMQEKGSLIEEIEAQMKALNEKRASAVLERRIADNSDEMREVEAAVKAAISVFSEHGSSNTTIAAATNAALAASAAVREQANQPVELDEFGRDVNLQKRKEMERRALARQRRKALFEAKRLSAMEIDGSYQKLEGESSTDESDSESAAYRESRKSLLECAEKVFSDASEEYSQLSRVKERFERWKRDYLSTYRDTYMSLSVPSIFSPYVRLELLQWDPLRENMEFFDMKWHDLLFDYGRPADGNDFAPDDADANLVPELVEKVAIPILHHQIAHCWDMLSTRETRNAVSATSLVINYVPASSEALAELFVAIRTRLTEAVTSIMVPTWSPLVFKAVPNAAQVAAYRFGMSVRLMKNICLWKDILALPVLENLVLNELLFGKVLPHVRSIASNVHDAVVRTERIVASLSGVWAGPSVTRNCSNKLQPLVDYVLLLGRNLEKRHLSGVLDTETGGLARRVKKMLVDLNEHDHAREIVRTFHLKEAV